MAKQTGDAGIAVVVCDGHRCRALRDRTDTGVAEGEATSLLGALSQRVRASRHGVLLRSDCLGACSRAPVVLLGRRDGSATGLLYGPVGHPDQVGELLRAVDDPGVSSRGRIRGNGRSAA